jgi:hypothetical protein
MLLMKKQVALAAALSLAAVMAAGCSGSKSAASGPTGSAKVAVSSSAMFTDVASMKLDVSGGTPSMSPPIQTTLTKNAAGTDFTAFITGIPAGTGRVFHTVAYKGDGTKLYEGTATADILPNTTAQVVIVLQDVNGSTGPTAHAPIIDSLASSATVVVPNGTVALTAAAHSPDGGITITQQWSAVCNDAAQSTGVFQLPANLVTNWTAPSGEMVCTLNLKVTDSRGNSTQSFFTIQVQQAAGSANITAFVNSWPSITSYTASYVYNNGVQDVDLSAIVSDPDGDAIRYVWSSNCGTPANFDYGAPKYSVSSPHFRINNVALDCNFTVTAYDKCTNGNCGAGIAGAQNVKPDGADRGGAVSGTIYGTHPAAAQFAPVIVGTQLPNQGGIVAPSTAYDLITRAYDPEGGILTFTYQAIGAGSVGAVVNVPDQSTVPAGTPSAAVIASGAQSDVKWTAPATLVAQMDVLVTVTSSKSGLSSTYTYHLHSSDPCAGQANGTDCSFGVAGIGTSNACWTVAACQNSVCTLVTEKACPASDQCHDTGTCDPNSGACSNPVKNNVSCNDGNACTQTDTCVAGACVGANPLVCVASDQCHVAGTCNTATGVCSNPNKADGSACNDGNACTGYVGAAQGDTCQAGVCAGGTLKSCAASTCQTAGTCNTVTGNCDGSVAQNVGTTCAPTANCTSFACDGTGACAGTAACAAGQNCGAATSFACYDTVVAPTAAKDVPVGAFAGLALDNAGKTYVTGPFTLTKSFDTFSLTSAGDTDVAVAQYDPVTHNAVWAKKFGDAAAQTSAGVAVTADGTVAVVGNFLGTLTAAPAPGVTNGDTGSGIQHDFLMGLGAADGSGKWVKQFADGLGGALVAVAANPNLNLIATCGYTDQAATDLVPGATYGGTAGDSGKDIVIAVFDSAGNLKWSKQLGGADNEECDALAIDDSGNVFAAGNYNGTTGLDLGMGPLPAPGNSFRFHLWAAKFNGTTGAILANASFGSGNGSHKAQALATDAAGNVFFAGAFTATIPFGGTTLTSANIGTTDAFVAKLNPNTFATQWAVRMGSTAGDEARGVAVDSFGNVVVTGLFNTPTAGTPTTGFAALQATGLAASDVFVAKLNGATGALATAGAVSGAAAYGDANTQNGNAVAVNRFGTGSVKDIAVFGGEFASGSITFGSSALTTTNPTDGYLMFGSFQ